MNDYDSIKKDLKKENDGEFVKKKFLSMRHLVQNIPNFDNFKNKVKLDELEKNIKDLEPNRISYLEPN
jgi:hypothetical protein